MAVSSKSGSGDEPNNEFPVTTRLVAQLLVLIDGGEFRPGERLPPERELALKMKTSRPSLRAAIASLVMIGILKSRPGLGTFVSPEILLRQSDSPDMPGGFVSSHLAEARLGIEAVVAELAVHRIKQHQIGELAGELVEMYAALDDPQKYGIHCARFYRVIARASGNPVLCAMLETVSTDHDGVRSHWNQPLQNLRETTAFHNEIYKAIRSRNPSLAKLLMTKHLRDTRQPEQTKVPALVERHYPEDGTGRKPMDLASI
jgi:GntR family transcriptional repressor for pyruvate dehydrogenase complex